MIEAKDINNRFSYHAPDEDAIISHEHIRFDAKIYADTINRYCPDCREKSLALTKLEEAVMWANAAIARINENGNRK